MSVDLSVIVPTYNRAELLRETLNSLLVQTYTNLEIIVVNHGSTDDTGYLLRWFQAHYHQIHILVVPQTATVAEAINYGIRHATAPWVSFLCDDDMWETYRAEAHFALVKANPSYRATYCGAWILENDQRRPLESSAVGARGFIYPQLLEDNFLTSVIARRSMWNFNEDPRMVGVEDWDQYLRMAKHNLFGGTPGRLVAIRYTYPSVSRSLARSQYFKAKAFMMQGLGEHRLARIARSDAFWSRLPEPLRSPLAFVSRKLIAA